MGEARAGGGATSGQDGLDDCRRTDKDEHKSNMFLCCSKTSKLLPAARHHLNTNVEAIDDGHIIIVRTERDKCELYACSYLRKSAMLVKIATCQSCFCSNTSHGNTICAKKDPAAPLRPW